MRPLFCPYTRTSLPCPKRQSLIAELINSLGDVFGHMNHGMGFCPLFASWMFIFAVLNLCFPFLLYKVTLRSPWSTAKNLLLLIFPLFCFQFFWRPYNYFMYFMFHRIFELPHETVMGWLPALSVMSAAAILSGSLSMTAHMNREKWLGFKSKFIKSNEIKSNVIKSKRGRSTLKKRTANSKTQKNVDAPKVGFKSLMPSFRDRSASVRDRSASHVVYTRSRRASSPRRNVSFLNLDIDPTYRCTRSGHIFGKWKYRST